jgi:hypothetical protein
LDGYVLRDSGAFGMHPGAVNTVRLRFAAPDEAGRDGARAVGHAGARPSPGRPDPLSSDGRDSA